MGVFQRTLFAIDLKDRFFSRKINSLTVSLRKDYCSRDIYIKKKLKTETIVFVESLNSRFSSMEKHRKSCSNKRKRSKNTVPKKRDIQNVCTDWHTEKRDHGLWKRELSDSFIDFIRYEI